MSSAAQDPVFLAFAVWALVTAVNLFSATGSFTALALLVGTGRLLFA